MITVLEAILNLSELSDVEIHGVSAGSIILDVAVVLDKDSLITESDVASIVNTAIALDELPDDLRVEFVADIQDLCPVGFCSNGGTCLTTNINAPSSCVCIDGFEGERCEDGEESGSDMFGTESDNDETGDVILIVVFGVFFILALVSVPCCCAIWFRRQHLVSTTSAHSNPGIEMTNLSSHIYYLDPATGRSPWTFGPANSSTLVPNYGGIQALYKSQYQQNETYSY
ncbi:uncharacterized protein [Amphiura filiformis]|uniref:uncharacterized protein n=1 Tax=Amphiura filiformis TaxID=82378 RepID=UPI003B219A14